MSVHENAVGRAVAALSLGAVRETQRREARRRNMGLEEMDLQFQVAISGDAGTQADWDTFSIDFDFPFYYAPGNRDSDLDRPHFTFGAVVEDGSPVVVSACVTGWQLNEETQGVTGATVAVCAVAPGTSQPVSFGGYVHLNFQGYAGVAEDETDI